MSGDLTPLGEILMELEIEYKELADKYGKLNDFLEGNESHKPSDIPEDEWTWMFVQRNAQKIYLSCLFKRIESIRKR